MARFRRVVHSVASSYAGLVAAAIYVLASVPLALHYLPREQFGLWTLMSSIAAYLSLIDLGMSGSVARHLIDHKDQPEGAAYVSVFKTGWLVLVVQGLIILVIGLLLAGPLAELLAIPAALRTPFVWLMTWQITALALAFATRIFNQLLQAHQRIDLISFIQITGLSVNLSALWVFFHFGSGVYSLSWAFLVSTAASSIASVVLCRQLKLIPQLRLGRISAEHFKELFGYGKDLFLVAVGTQLILASQTMIITRRLGLEAAAVWYAGLRMFNLANQAIWRIYDAATPAYSEMIVRGERSLLRVRFEALVILTASLSGSIAAGYAICNSLFVSVWTAHKIAWHPVDDLLLGIWMVELAVLRCNNGFVLLTKDVGFMRYVYFIEGIIFIVVAFLTAKFGGLTAIIICSIVCSMSLSGAYGLWRICRYFQISIRELLFGWLAPMARMLAFVVPISIGGWFAFQLINDSIIRLALSVLLSATCGSYFFLRFGLSQTFQRELIARAPKGLSLVLKKVFVVSPS